MKQVIVLMDDENRQSDYINKHSLGKDPYLSTMCRMPTEAELQSAKKFVYEVFCLFTNDKKLEDFLSKHDGIIISIDTENFRKNPTLCVSQIKKITDTNQNTSIAIVFDHDQETKNTQLINKIREICCNNMQQNSLHKVFILPYVKQTESLIHSPKFIVYDETNKFDDTLKINQWFTEKLYRPVIPIETKSTSTCDTLTSRTITATQLMDEFYKETLPIELWDHYGRLRVVWCSIIRFGFDQTILKDGWLCESWKRYKTSIGHGDKWNYTLTRFWINVLAGIQESGKYKTFNELYDNNPKIHSGKLFMEYYGNEIFSDEAKNNWIKPTKQSKTIHT
jgi:hypothetical protein